MSYKRGIIAAVIVGMLAISGCSESKPSEDTIWMSVWNDMTEGTGDAHLATKVADCAAPKILDTIDAKTLNKYVDGDFNIAENDDMKNIALDCAGA